MPSWKIHESCSTQPEEIVKKGRGKESVNKRGIVTRRNTTTSDVDEKKSEDNDTGRNCID